MVPSLSNRALIRILTFDILQPVLNRRPSAIPRCQSHRQNELYRECHHCVRSSDMITHKIPAITHLQLCLQPVKVLDHILLQARSQLLGYCGVNSSVVQRRQTMDHKGAFSGMDVFTHFDALGWLYGQEAMGTIILLAKIPVGSYQPESRGGKAILGNHTP